MSDQLSTVRRDYGQSTLVEENIPSEPFELLRGWLQYALDQSIPDANAMNLATLDKDGYPTNRVVLLRDLSPEGLSFFTNYLSAKGKEIEALPKGSLNFFWSTLERQVRVRGHFEKLTAAESDAYFASRPRASQIGAWSSPQSEAIANRLFLDQRNQEFESKFAKQSDIPRPPHWGGYRLVPNRFEFWQGRPSRLHDRLVATLHGDIWIWGRLAP